MSKRTVALATIIVMTLSSCGGGKSSGAGSPHPSAAASAAALNCGGESPVWAIGRAKAYLLASDPHYGKTKYGHYICLSQARAEGLHPARHPFRKRHKKQSPV